MITEIDLSTANGFNPEWEHIAPEVSPWNPTNHYFGITDISDVRKRDQYVSAMLLRLGWIVIRIWEHAFKEDPDILGRILDAMEKT